VPGKTPNGLEKRRAVLAVVPQSKAAAKTITEIWKLAPKTYDRVSIATELTALADSGTVKRFKVDGPKGNPMWKYWLDPIIR
jgi:Fe2+ or Zn2+ uptake regulation protein